MSINLEGLQDAEDGLRHIVTGVTAMLTSTGYAVAGRPMVDLFQVLKVLAGNLDVEPGGN